MPRPEQLGYEVASGLRRLVPSEVASFNELSVAARRARFLLVPEAADFAGSNEALGRHLPDHPFVGHFARHPESPAVTVSDFLSQRDFLRTGVYNELYRRASVDRVLGLRFATGPAGEIAVALCRKGREFADQERFV